MNYATYNTITVRHYQELIKIHSGEGEDLDKIIQSVALLTGTTNRQVEEMPLGEFNRVSSEIAKIFKKEIKGKPKKNIRVSGREYCIIYEPSKLCTAQYIEIQTWLQMDMLGNLHKIFASLLSPVKRFSWVKMAGKYNADKHVELSEAILDIPFIHVYHACVFFSTLWQNSIVSLSDYLAKEVNKTGKMNMSKEKLRMILQSTGAGFITLKK